MPQSPNRTRSPRTAFRLAAALLVAVACGRGKNQSADSAAPADSTALGPGVGDAKPQMHDGFVAGQKTLDSLKAAGETPASGIAKGIQPAIHAANNDSSAKAHTLKTKPTNVP